MISIKVKYKLICSDCGTNTELKMCEVKDHPNMEPYELELCNDCIQEREESLEDIDDSN